MAKVRITGVPSKTIAASPRHQATIEAEGGETIAGDINQDGFIEHLNIQGPSHAKGGVPLKATPGAFVFSDTSDLKITDPDILKYFGIGVSAKDAEKGEAKGRTPAQIAKRFELNKFTEVLKDADETDPVRLRTAQTMVENNTRKLAELAMIQEGMKGYPNGIPAISESLFVPDQGSEEGAGDAPVMQFGGQVPQFQRGGTADTLVPVPFIDTTMFAPVTPGTPNAARDSAATGGLLTQTAPAARPQSSFQFVRGQEFFIGNSKYKIDKIENNKVFIADGNGKPSAYKGVHALDKKFFDTIDTGRPFSMPEFGYLEPDDDDFLQRGSGYHRVAQGIIGTTPQPNVERVMTVVKDIQGPGRLVERGNKFTIGNDSYEVIEPALTKNGNDRYIKVKNQSGSISFMKPGEISKAYARNEFRFDSAAQDRAAAVIAKRALKRDGVAVVQTDQGPVVRVATPAAAASAAPKVASKSPAPTSTPRRTEVGATKVAPSAVKRALKEVPQAATKPTGPSTSRGDMLEAFEEGGEIAQFGKGGAVKFLRHQQDAERLNPGLMKDLSYAAQTLGFEIGISTAITGHSAKTTSGNRSRHTRGAAVDIASIDGVTYAANPTEWARKAEALAAFLQKAGAARNRESGNQKAVLFGFNDRARGGNHLNHIHYSNTGGHHPHDGHDHGESAAAAVAAAPVIPQLIADSDMQAVRMPANVNPLDYFREMETGGEVSLQAGGDVPYRLPDSPDGTWGTMKWDDGHRIEMKGGKIILYGADGKELRVNDKGVYNPYAGVYNTLKSAEQNKEFEIAYPNAATVNLFGAFGRQHRGDNGEFLPAAIPNRLDYSFDWSEFGKRHDWVEREYAGGQKAFQDALKDPTKHTDAAGWFQKRVNNLYTEATGKPYFNPDPTGSPYDLDSKFGAVTFLTPAIRRKAAAAPAPTAEVALEPAATPTQRAAVAETTGDPNPFTPAAQRQPRPNEWWTQDQLALAGAMGDQFGINKYGPTEQQIPYALPEFTPVDPARAIAAIQGSYLGAMEGTDSLPPAVARAYGLAASGQIADKAANVISEYENANAQAANQNSAQVAQIRNQNSVQNAALRKEYLDADATASQNYDDATRDARARSLKTFIGGMTNAQQTNQWLPEMFPQFRVDPSDGRIIHDPMYAADLTVGAQPGVQSTEAAYAKAQSIAKNFSTDPEEQRKIAADIFRTLSSGPKTSQLSSLMGFLGGAGMAD